MTTISRGKSCRFRMHALPAWIGGTRFFLQAAVVRLLVRRCLLASPIGILLTALAIGLVLVSPVSAQSTDPPWEGPVLSAKADAILGALSSEPAPESASVEILLREQEYKFDRQGRKRWLYRNVYRVLTREAVTNWSSFEVSWAPWYERRPIIRGRVITPDGRVHQLDPDTIAELPVTTDDPTIYSDRKLLRAPLPAVTPGAVVEYVIEVEEKQPFFDRGIVSSFNLVSFSPMRQLRLSIEFPLEMPLRYRVLGSDLKPTVSENDEMRLLVFEIGPIEPLEDVELYLPADVPLVPKIVFSTGKSWADVAAGYQEAVQKQLTAFVAETPVKKISGNAMPLNLRKTAQKLLGIIQDNVRYTGLEFGENSIVPHTPEETLKRGYGDCKDQSTLLVGMLNAAGIPAHLALLRAGSTEDVVPDLPGMGMFDHAIVYVPGNPPVWIDPTVKFLSAGRLPSADQARYALVISPETTGLVKTPRSSSRANRYTRTRKIIMSETETGRMIQRTHASGVIDHYLRSTYASRTKKEIRSGWEDLARNDYKANLKRLKYSDPYDLKKIFFVTVEMEDVNRAIVADMNAVALLYPGWVFSMLPSELTSTTDKSENEDETSARKSPLVLSERHITELKYQIVPPRGYMAETIPDDETIKLGPAQLKINYSPKANNVVEINFTFDTGSGVFSADDVAKVAERIDALGVDGDLSQWNLRIVFQKIAAQHLEAGRVAYAVREYRKLLDAEPKESIRHSQLANALLKAGLGDVARKSARRAVELAPDSASAHAALASVLSHDRLGRYLRAGFEWEDALASFQRALELQPDDSVTRGNYAILLEYDANGFRYSMRGRLQEAIEQYRKLGDDLDAIELRANLAAALYNAGRLDELKRYLVDKESTYLHNSLLLTAIALTDGVGAAQARAARLAGSKSERRELLAIVVDNLNALRKYRQALQLLEAITPGSPPDVKPQFLKIIQTIRALRPFDKSRLTDRDPLQPVLKLFEQTLIGDPYGAPIVALFVNHTDPKPPDALRRIPKFIRTVRQTAHVNDALPRRVLDSLALLQFTVEGSDEVGYRVIAEYPGAFKSAWFVVLHKGKYRLWDPGAHDEHLGSKALAFVEAGNHEAAAQWLNWASQEQTSKLTLFDPYSGTPFARLWSVRKKENEQDVRIAAALAAPGPDWEMSVKILTEARDQSDSGFIHLHLDRALVDAYLRLKKPEKAHSLIDRLIKQSPSADEPFERKVEALTQQNEHEQIDQLTRQRLEKHLSNPRALRYLGSLLVLQGKMDEAEQQFLKLAKQNYNPADLYYLLAWHGVFQNPVPQSTLQYGQEAARLSDYNSPLAMLSLAIVYAELGRVSEARNTIFSAIDIRGMGPTGDDWYVFGRIAEHCGLKKEAVDAYRRVIEADVPVSFAYHLTKRRLKVLGHPVEKEDDH